MKKSLVALAALAVAGVASAQSSVTLFGVVDAAFNGYQNKSENIFGREVKVTKNQLTNGGYNSSRLGFRGTEDLGGGLAASFWLEAGLSNDDGNTGGNIANSGSTVTGLFNRRSTVSLSGAFGEVRLGRDYTPTFWNDTVFDPFGTNGVGTSLIFTANGGFGGSNSPSGFQGNNMYVRASNSVGYFLPPNLGGFYGQVMYAFNESTKYDNAALTPDVANTQRAGRYVGGRFGYANGPLDVAASYGEATNADNFFAGTTSSLETANIGASWDFGVVKLFGEYSQAKNKTDYSNPLAITNVFQFTDPKAKGWLIGVTVPVGPGLIRASYSGVKYSDLPLTAAQVAQIGQVFGVKDPKADKFALGYVHNLSKRTALYATVAYVDNKDNTLFGNGLATAGSFYAPSGTTANNAAAQAAIGATHPTSSVGYDIGIRHAF